MEAERAEDWEPGVARSRSRWGELTNLMLLPTDYKLETITDCDKISE